MSARIIHLTGLSDYQQTHALQADLVQARAAGAIPDTILLLEHQHVITVGRARNADRNVLEASDIPVVPVERGGDVTWHGPGQLVAYPIVGLSGPRRDLHLHLQSLEGAVLTLVRAQGLEPRRDDRNTGVWLPDPSGGPPKKVCSVGIACRKWVTWHGLALNVSPDPDVWSHIRPCGFDADIMTRLADHLDVTPSVTALIQPLAVALVRTLDLRWDGVVVRTKLSEAQDRLLHSHRRHLGELPPAP